MKSSLEHYVSRSLQSTRRAAAVARVRFEARHGRRPEAPSTSVHWETEAAFNFRNNLYVRARAVSLTSTRIERVQLLDADGTFLATVVNGQNLDDFAFEFQCRIPDPSHLDGVRMRAVLLDGSQVEHHNVVGHAMTRDPYHKLENRFFNECRSLGAERAATAVEIGSRARSGHVRRQLVSPMHYVGLDIAAGENTDVVGDAHAMSTLFEPGSVDAIFSMSTFEHLAMPWKVAVEMNRVLTPGGLIYVASHQAFPVHDAPLDYWRFSTSAWHALFNAATGFEVVDTAAGEPASIVPHLEHSITRDLDKYPAFIATSVLARKISDTTLDWPVDLATTSDASYPE